MVISKWMISAIGVWWLVSWLVGLNQLIKFNFKFQFIESNRIKVKVFGFFGGGREYFCFVFFFLKYDSFWFQRVVNFNVTMKLNYYY